MLFLGMRQSGFAATYTWVGNTTVDWSTTGGFDAVPANGNNALVFGSDGTVGTAATHILNDNISALTIGSMTFNSGAPSYTIGGTGIITLGTTGTVFNNNSGVLQTINVRVNGGNFAETITGNGDLKFGGVYAWGGTSTLTVNNTGVTTFTDMHINDTSTVARTGTIAGSGAVVVTGVISNGSGNGTAVGNNVIVYAGTGSLTLSGINTYTGATTAAQGSLIAGGDAPGNATGVFGNINSGSINLGSTTLTGAASILTNGAFTIGRSITQVTASTNSALIIGGIQTSGTSTYSNTINVKANTTLTSAAGGEVDFTGNILGVSASNIIIDGGGIVKLTGTNTYGSATAHANSVTIQGGTTLNVANADVALGAAGNDLNFNNGTLQFGAVFDPSVSRTMNFQSGGAAFDTNGNTITFANAVGNGGTGGLTLNDSNVSPGMLILAAANTYTGGTTVNKGTLRLSGAGTLGGTSGALTVNTGGTLGLNGTNQSVGNLTGSGGTIINNSGSGTSTLTIGTGNGTGGNYAGVIADNTSGSGQVALTKTGSGTIALTGANTYTGATTINAGTLAVGGASGTLGGTAITASGSGTLQIGTTGSTVTTTLGTGAAGSITINSGGGLSLSNGAFNSLTVNNGSSTGLTFGNGSSLSFDVGGSSSDTITFGGGTGVFASGTIIVNLSLLSNLTGGTQTLIAGDFTSSGTTNFALGTTTNTGFLNGYTFSLRETSTGLFLDMSSTSSAYWKGGTSASWATIGNFTTDAGGTTARSAALDSSTNVTFNATGASNFSATTLDGSYTISGLVFNVGGVGINNGTGTNTLTIASGAGVTVNGGLGAITETIGVNVELGSTQTWTVTDAASTLNVSGNISGSGAGLSKSGAGTLVLSGNNTYTGATNIIAGNVSIQSNGALGGTSGVIVNSGAGLLLQGNITTSSATALTLNGAGTSTLGALENVSGNNTYSGLITLGSATTIGSDSGLLTLSNTGTITGFGLNLTLTGAGDGSLASIVGTNAGSLTKSGAGTWTLGGANTYTGGTTVSGGTLALTGAGKLGATSGSLTVNTGGTLNLGGTSQAVGNFTGTGGTVAANGTSTLTIGSGNGTGGNYAGALTNGTGTLSLTKTGTGTITLSGTNTYTGATTVSAGALNLQSNGAATGSGISVASGAALQLTGGITTTNALGLTLNGAGVTASPNGALENVSGTNTYSGLVTLGSDSTIGSDAGALALTNTGTITGSGFGLTLTGAGNGSVASIIGTGAGALTKNGTGTWTLSGANTYTGVTTVNAGTLVYTSVGSLANSTAINLGSGATATNLTYGGTGGTLSTALTLTGTTGTVTLGNSGTGAINYSAAPVFSGAGAKTLTLGNTTDSVGGSIGGIVNGTGTTTLTKAGLTNSTWTLTGTTGATGTNTYTGTTNIIGGVLSVTGAAADPLANSYLNLNGADGTHLAVFQSSGTINRALSGTAAAGNLAWASNSGFAAKGGTLTITLTGAANNTLNGDGSTLLWQVGNFMAAGAAPMVFGSSTADSQVIFTNNFSLNTVDAFSRVIQVEKGVGGDSALLSGVISHGYVEGITNGVPNGAQTPSLTGLTKTGAGTLILAGNNTYKGATLVSAGKLLINGDQSAATGATSVSATATLGGAGIVGGAVTLNSGSFLRPGATETGTGLLTFANSVTLAAGSTVNLQVNGADTRGTSYAAIDANGSFFGQSTGTGLAALAINFSTSLTDGAVLNLFDGFGFTSVSSAFTSVTLTGIYTGALVTNGLTGIDGAYVATINGQTLSLNNFTGDLTVTGTFAIPEPATYALLGGAAALVGVLLMRRRRSVAVS
jgi:fibronectin-binding autotransporter adhesin